MSLAPGARLDGYEILGPLGSGGMGEVYRARDSVLKREVAIKLLPSFVSQDSDRLHRFQQEAQAAAALNHPNILAVFQFGSFEGSPYLVSELLEGDTLRQLLQRGPLAVRKAIDIGVQVAHGLAAAHDKGIVHRDLKPENLFVTKDGRVKILDFGLAKLTQRAPESGDPGPTLTHQGTDPGMIMGTVGYMSPEQVRGHTADSRADIFAFGAILYEMLAGKRAFKRSTSAETMTAILNEDPPAVSQVVQNTPPGLQRVVHRCLEKNPEQRFQSASDLAFALEAISESGISAAVPSPAPIQRKSRKLFLWSGCLVAILALATAAYFFVRRPQHVPFEHYSIQKVIESKHVQQVAISPDGAYLAAVEQDANGNPALLLHHIPTGSERPIVQDAAYKYQDITFSPDGSYIYFRIDALVKHTGDREDVYRVPILGGQATRVLESVDAPLSFIDSSQRVCFYRQNFEAGTYQFFSASAEGGDEQILANGKKPFPLEPNCAPNGRFAVLSDDSGVQSLDFDSGRKQTLASSTTIGGWIDDLHWASGGKGLFATIATAAHPNSQIGFLSYPGGIWRQITNDLTDYWGLSSTADGRTIATRTHDRNTKFGVLSLKDPSHINEYQTEDLAWFIWLDNDRIVESSVKESGLRIVDLVKNEKTSISVAKGHSFIHPALCGPDMLVVSGGSLDGFNRSVYKMHLDGSGLTQMTKGPADLFPECTADGKWLFYADNRDPNNPLLMRQSLQGGAAKEVIPAAVFLNVSLDGKFLVTQPLVKIAPFQIISTDSLKVIRTLPPVLVEHTFAFSADGKSIFYDTKTGADTTIWRQPLDAAAAVKVASLPRKNVFWIRPSPDGKKLGLVISAPTSEAVLIHDAR